ncbi:MAG: selenium cofactor biosynthesis protein YqeC [Chloroflexota bacterium]
MDGVRPFTGGAGGLPAQPAALPLDEALRLGPQPRIALTGAGGKTTAMFSLGRRLAQRGAPVCLAATTHLATAQLGLADRRFTLAPGAPLAAPADLLPGQVLLFTGPQAGGERTAGLEPAQIDQLRDWADALGLALVIEADGSKRLPLKAPAAHEPVAPEWVDLVVVTAGLSGVGQPLDEAHVHRPERFAALSGLALGDPVTPQALAAVLAHPQGGLYRLPPGARRVALLNQADTPERQAAARRIAALLQPAYAAVAIAALAPPAGSSLAAGVQALIEPVAGVILAAGGSTRMAAAVAAGAGAATEESATGAATGAAAGAGGGLSGAAAGEHRVPPGTPKQLLLWRGRPLVRHVAEMALRAGLSPVVVVTGSAAEGVAAALEGLPLQLVHNPDWAAGQSASMIAGLRALPDTTGAAVFLLADQPQIPETLVEALVELHAAGLAPVAAPLVDGRRANPVLFDRALFPELLAVTGDTGGRALFARHRPAWLPWHDPSAALDVDTPADYRRLQEL